MPFGDYQYLAERGVPEWAIPQPAPAPVAGTQVSPAAATLPGAPSFNYVNAYGGIPQVSNPVATAGQVIAGNQTNLPAGQQLATQTNTFNAGQAVAPYAANLPNYAALTQTASSNILGDLQGQVSPDTIRLLTQQGAERGAATGQATGPNTNAAFLQALGLTSEELKRQGQSELSAAMARTPTGPQFNPASLFVTPEQQQAAQQGANIFAAAPIPASAASANLAATQSGVRTGAGSVSPVNPLVGPSSSPTMPSFSALAPQPTAPGASPSRFGTGELSTSTDGYPGPDASLDEIYAWLDLEPDNPQYMPGQYQTGSNYAEDYSQVPGFESLYQ